MRPRLLLIAAILLLTASLPAKKKNPEDFTQTLALPKDPPAVAVGETRRLIFHVSPLSGKGLLSQQTREALKAILKENGGVPVVHIRAFVAGSGDVRRVPQIVSEVFGERKLPVPSVSVILCGGLPLENAQVELEAVSVAKRDVNQTGLAFESGREELSEGNPALPVRALLEKSLLYLATRIPMGSALEISCFVTDVADAVRLNGDIAGRFPGAAIDLIQTQRAPFSPMARCEGVARGGAVTAGQIAFTGTRVAFGSGENVAAAAFQRLDRDLTEAGAPPANIVSTNIYALAGVPVDALRKLRPATAAVTILPVEGVASIDAGFAADVVATVSR